MFVVFYTVKIVYICAFMTCSTSYCLCEKTCGSMECVCVCVCVCVSVCVRAWTCAQMCVLACTQTELDSQDRSDVMWQTAAWILRTNMKLSDKE
jgi:hypothetical protein